MAIIIKQEKNKYWLYNLSHTPVNFTPFTRPEAIEDFIMLMKVGELKELCGLELNKEYADLEWTRDFEIVERISQIKHEDGLV